MSRTFRRKNWELEHPNKYGSKVNGFYTEYDKFIHTGNGHAGYCVYRPMTEREKNEKYHTIHGESKHYNAWSPAKFYRKKWNRENESHNVRETLKLVNSGGEYDPVFIAKFPRQWREWLMW